MSNKQPVGIRRIVTGHEESGKAIVIADGPTPGVKTTPNRPGVIFHNMWTTTTAPARFDEPKEATSVDLPLPPPSSGTTFRLIEFPPEAQVEQVDDETAKNMAPMAHCSTVKRKRITPRISTPSCIAQRLLTMQFVYLEK